ncbi:methionine ABC transporter ATP-binding protein [Hathewaya histolytica]|uniref:ABC transporter ATP-binding protein n=1 Tax=Hathewaya histolytica TaxID=1498 RepID=A0A4U9QUG9_HATHI|nr:ABC transporter ATP-binding protein [Hathewaya histolytica]
MNIKNKIIEIKDLNKNFNNKVVLKNISFDVEEGEILGIVGHSGAGKSTLLRCLNGLETYENGSIKIDENEVKSLNLNNLRTLRRNMGMIFQGFNLLNSRNVYKNIAFPIETWGYNKKAIDEKVKSLIKLVHLEDKLYSNISSLSGGEKQRVAIARALALEPKILLCDEATSALDPKTTKSILRLLKEINEKLNITIVLVTHEMEVVKELCTKVALLNSGNLISHSNVQDLFLYPNPVLKEFLDEDLSILPTTGINIKLYFSNNVSSNSIISSMARDLNIDFSIVFGKLEQFRNDILGNLIINTNEKNKKEILNYLNEKSILCEVI